MWKKREKSDVGTLHNDVLDQPDRISLWSCYYVDYYQADSVKKRKKMIKKASRVAMAIVRELGWVLLAVAVYLIGYTIMAFTTTGIESRVELDIRTIRVSLIALMAIALQRRWHE